ncbi:MAG: Lipoprotein-releasing system transmembrane protein LolE [Candidatus Anoxychlamydiales bacterium]|nr:Lipoprotein-releasing system transmembrane protein LolE [Candidatus Anoxychlamydiales bacterium]
MFEFKIAFKYLLFKKSRFSSSLISLLSILIISIAVWLVLVFLSVTNGIEKNWIKKLTTLNAPVRIAPTEKYFSSYYYLIDSHSSKSNYTAKNIKEKIDSELSDPYDSEIDMELPYSFPKPIYEKGVFLDPIKKLNEVLENQKSNLDISFQDYEISASLMRLTLNRGKKDLFTEFKDEKINFLTQMSYLLSLTENNPNLKSLILPPSNEDLNHLVYQMDKSFDSLQKDIPLYPEMIEKEVFKKRVCDLFKNIAIEKIELEKGHLINLDLIKNISSPIKAQGLVQSEKITTIILDELTNFTNFKAGEIFKDKDSFYFKTQDKQYTISNNTYIHLGKNSIFEAKLENFQNQDITSFNDLKLNIKGFYQGAEIAGKIPFQNAKLNQVKVDINTQNQSFYTLLKNTNKISLPKNSDKTAVLLPKNYQSSGVLIGDNGYLSYASMTINSNQEMRLPIFVAGFYDPGVLPIGNKCVIVPSDVTKTINATNNNFSFDGTPPNGLYVWFNDLKKADLIKNRLQEEFEKENIASFFNITTYKDFEFSKDLLQQFQSDRTLFTLIAIIILAAACSNIISMLVLLVNDKKKEIAILRAMGASSKSIALIFGFSGFVMGILSSIIGVFLSILTLKHLDVVIKILNTIQGHSFFNASFFGDTLPNDLSLDALMFVFIITPILALIAGLVPAIKASRLHPSSILRSQ